MKKFILAPLGALLVISLFLFIQCKSDEPNPDDGNWTEAEKVSYNQAISIQDEISNSLEDWFLSMDSMAAINKAYQAFLDEENVSTAYVNKQGIAVQYANGMRGGIYLNPKDDKSEGGQQLFGGPLTGDYEESLKSMVNKKKMILINPHYFERSQYTDQIRSITNANLQRVNTSITTFYKNEEATVDRFTQLADYGIVQIYSHGWAWPKENNITDVYLLTGETVNETTTKKYWNEIKNGNIPVVKVTANKYLVSPEFITSHNDFSKDTIMFFGGFCYSFLGNWPDIVNSFADGAYLGFDWSVYTYHNANWSVNSMYFLSDTMADHPQTLNEWFSDGTVAKSYWNDKDSRNVSIHYAGDGTLRFWGENKVSASIEALASDGAPIAIAGEKETYYSFRCNLSGQANGNYSYTWDTGEGFSPVTINNENGASIKWVNNGNYTLSVTVKEIGSGNVIATATASVSIESGQNILEFLQTLKKVSVTLTPGWAIHLSDGSSPGGTFEYVPTDWNINADVVWSGSSFSFTGSTWDGDPTFTINGTLSEDGTKLLNVTATEHYANYQLESKLVFVNLFTLYYPGEADVSFIKPFDDNMQDHVTTTEFKKWDYFNQQWITLQSIDWNLVDAKVRFYNVDK